MIGKETISVIIPTFNEAEQITATIDGINRFADHRLLEIIVVDGGSTDQTVQLAKKVGAHVVISPLQGRAAQMNYGAELAQGEVLYFVHADVKIHPDYVSDIFEAIAQGYHLGCYRYVFDSKHLLLKVNAFCIRFNKIWCRGGDQTLFVIKKHFNELNGYKSNYLIMEDYDFILRAQQKFKFRIIPKNIVVSARKYQNNNYFTVMWANYTIFKMFFNGASQDDMVKKYKSMLNYR